MKRRRAEEGGDAAAAGSEGSGADFDTGARHFRDTKQVKNDLRAIQGVNPHSLPPPSRFHQFSYFYFYLF
jgi:hypothetical protein